MGTLYECLREARLEQFYPAFRANGITRSEALINLGMPEFCALGITGSEDKRRLIELVNIIKSVHNAGLSDSPVLARRNVNSQSHASHSTSSPSGRGNVPNRSQNHHRNTTSEQNPLRAQRAQRDSPLRDRLPNFSVASYMDMLEYMTDSSGTEEGEEDSDEEEEEEEPVVGAAAVIHTRNVSSPSAVRASTSKAPVERIKHSQERSYNYGVHKVTSPTKATRSSRSRHMGDDKIKVCVRKRPLTRREQRAKEEDVVTVESTNTLTVNEPKLAVDLKAYTLQHEFIFDEVFDESCSNEDVYIRAARPLISCVFTGGTATCFAYGQTGAGKTHTMLGNENVPGLYLLAGQDIFSIIQSEKYGKGLHVWVSFFEIYCGQLFDLLNRRNRLHAREDGSRQVCIAGLTETEATNLTSLVQTLQYGNSVRSKGATGVNPDSSRSHAVLQLDIRNNEDIKVGKISFIDLAGSERASDVTDTDKQTRLEGAEINQSLLALKECIRAIDQDSRHTPFRQSKLTHILKDSFIGNSRTCMIANISPTQTACENTLNTMRYADRVKELKRDSVRSSSTVGQAMNLLMNIPPTAPTIFHPSSSSTPMRKSTQSRRPAEAIEIDPSETPIRGHGMPRRSAARESSSRSRNNIELPVAPTADRVQQIDPSSAAGSASVVKPAQTTSSSRSRSGDTAASQGSEDPPPDASPSESDHTDTDSCNATNPTYTLVTRAGHRGGQPVTAPVIKSTDTEFDFPTSDFNNVNNDLNDLNRSNPKQQAEPYSGGVTSHSHGRELPAAATAENVLSPPAVSASSAGPPIMKPVVYKSTDTLSSDSKPRDAVPTVSGLTKKFQSSDVTSPLQSKHNPSFKKAFMKELISSDDSVDDEEMFADGPQTVVKKTSSPSEQSDKPSVPLSPAAMLRPQLMIPQPAESSDLARFTQRQTSLASGINDLSGKNLKEQNSAHKQTDNSDVRLQEGEKKTTAFFTNKSKSTTPNIASQIVQSSGHKVQIRSATDKGSSQQGRSHAKESRVIGVIPEVGSGPASHGSPDSEGQGFSKRQPIESEGSRVRRHSGDGSDSKQRRRRVSHSPSGQVSDDSTDSIRASMSDQGQSGNRKVESTRGRIRKERSDPMLALDMQKKKHTLPAQENITKMLNRSNTPKSGIIQGSSASGWKVVHNELPPHHRPHTPNRPASPQEIHGGQSCQSESRSLPNQSNNDHVLLHGDIRSGDDVNKPNPIDRDSSKSRHNTAVGNIGARSKQLPQTPVTRDGDKKQDADGVKAIHADSADHISGESNSSRNNPAIVTEKLSSGAVFSPIHPQPVTSVGTKVSTEPSVSSSLLLHPTPVTAVSASSQLPGISSVSESVSDGAALASLQENRMNLVSAHEDQLATITSLCRYEMRLLLNAKKVSGKKGFDDYLRRVNDILQQKMTAISSLQEQIYHYRSSNSVSQSGSVMSSVQMSVAESHGTRSSTQNSFLPE